MEAKSLGDMLGYKVVSNLGKYVGIPLLHSRITKSTYQDILEKMDRRLLGSNGLNLSLLSRVTLLNQF
ncbi:conserved hypothetical protein [Ricinus communis]|uniref:Uncharacterized protein n=1 Tax=Ricinus communis TaxID=3988 RepID=B9SA25_RICCO|nr:conserved hypothetical protein [Ricinus communis]